MSRWPSRPWEQCSQRPGARQAGAPGGTGGPRAARPRPRGSTGVARPEQVSHGDSCYEWRSCDCGDGRLSIRLSSCRRRVTDALVCASPRHESPRGPNLRAQMVVSWKRVLGSACRAVPHSRGGATHLGGALICQSMHLEPEPADGISHEGHGTLANLATRRCELFLRPPAGAGARCIRRTSRPSTRGEWMKDRKGLQHLLLPAARRGVGPSLKTR